MRWPRSLHARGRPGGSGGSASVAMRPCAAAITASLRSAAGHSPGVPRPAWIK
jgi:hypothetical protein